MIRSVLQVFGAATFSLLTLVPSVAGASEIDFRGVGHGATITVAGSARSGSFMVVSGNFLLTTSGSIRTQAEAYLTSLYNAGSSIYTQSVASVLEVARGDREQDQIVAKVSEPSTLLLVGVAFLLFAKRARRDQHRTKV